MSDIINTVFNNISSENENSVTEVLASLLRKEKFRNILFSFFEIPICKKVEIETQQNYGDNGKPDLLIRSSNTKVFIENKILDKTTLTNNQPKGYLEELNRASEKNKKLIFLLPDGYLHIEELKNGINKYSNLGICTIKEWPDLLKLLKRENKKINSDLLSDCIIYFENTVDVSLEETSIFSDDEINLLKRINVIYKYLHSIEEDYCKIDSNNRKASFCEYGIGYSYTLNNGKELFIGISPYSHYQYCFAIWSKEKFFETFSINKKKYEPFCDNKKDSGGFWTYYELENSDFDNKDGLKQLIKRLVKKIDN